MIRRVLVAGVLVTGCTSWRAQPVAPATLISERKPDPIRVQFEDGTRMVIHSPRMQGDTVVGRTKPADERVYFVASKVATIETREPDRKKTAFFAGGLAVAGVLAFIFREDLNLAPGYSGIF